MNATANTKTTAVLPEWLYYEQIVYSCIIGLIGIPGNILIILVFANLRDKTTTDDMVFSMAISDLFGSFVCATFNTLQHVRVNWLGIGTTWVTRTIDYLNMLTAVISIWLLSITAIDRYMKTCRPHSVVFTISRARWTCVIIYAVVPIVTGPQLFLGSFDHEIEGYSGTFKDEWNVTFFIIAAGCCVSLVITGVAYMLVAFALCKRLKIKKGKRRATKPSHATGNMFGQATPVSSEHDGCIKSAFGGKLRDQEDRSVPVSLPIDVNQVYVIENELNGICSKDDEMSKVGLHMHKNAGIDEALRNEQTRVNRTTIMMFLITIINTLTFILLFIGKKLKESDEISVFTIGYISRISYMINYIANPLMYIMMSSKFREGILKLFRRQ